MMRMKLSKSDWENIGKKAGWLKKADLGTYGLGEEGDFGTPSPSGGPMPSEKENPAINQSIEDKKKKPVEKASVSEISTDEASSIRTISKEIKGGPYFKERKICGHLFQSHNRSYKEDGSVLYSGAIRFNPDLPEPQRSWPQNTTYAEVYVTPDNKTRVLEYSKTPMGATEDKSTSHAFKEDGGRF